MKKLQKDFTTPEQSKQLLELGVPADSANYYGKGGKLRNIDGTIPYSLLWETGCTPCWSVGRLMEIYDICFPEEHLWANTQNQNIKTFGTYIDFIISLYNFAVNCKCLNFSKLEE